MIDFNFPHQSRIESGEKVSAGHCSPSLASSDQSIRVFFSVSGTAATLSLFERVVGRPDWRR